MRRGALFEKRNRKRIEKTVKMWNRNLVVTALFHGFLSMSSAYLFSALNVLDAHVKRFANESFQAHDNSTLSDEQIGRQRTHELSSTNPAETAWSATAGLIGVGVILTTFLVGPIADRIGRCKVVMLLHTVVVVSCSITLFVAIHLNLFELFLVGCFLRGLLQSWQCVHAIATFRLFESSSYNRFLENTFEKSISFLCQSRQSVGFVRIQCCH